MSTFQYPGLPPLHTTKRAYIAVLNAYLTLDDLDGEDALDQETVSYEDAEQDLAIADWQADLIGSGYYEPLMDDEVRIMNTPVTERPVAIKAFHAALWDD